MSTLDKFNPSKPEPDDILDIDFQPQTPHPEGPATASRPDEVSARSGGDASPAGLSAASPRPQVEPESYSIPSPNGTQPVASSRPSEDLLWSSGEAAYERSAIGPAAPGAPAIGGETEGSWFGLLVREMFETVGLAIIIFLIIRVGIQNYRIEGQSMEPNFHDGEYLIVNKLAYRLGEFERGDVIVFHYPNDPSKDYIKRVIGLPGDTVEIRGGMLYVNTAPVQEPYDHLPMVRDEPPTVVEPGTLYVLGDNRPASSDSRSWGLLPEDLVIGKAWLAIWPPSIFGIVDHSPVQVGPGMAQGP